MHICYDKDGKSHAGEVRTKKTSAKASEALFRILLPLNLKFNDDGQSEIQILKPGKWDHPIYGMVEINDKTQDEFIKNFKKDLRAHSSTIGLPIDEEHRSSAGAVGWIKKLKNRGSEGLFAIVEWNIKGQQLIKDAIYRFFSPEFYFAYEDPESRKTYNNVLVGGALTNRPYFKKLEPVVLSEHDLITNDEKDMQLNELIKKSLADLDNDEKSFITSHFSELSEDDKAKFTELKPAETFKEGDVCTMGDGSKGKMKMVNDKMVCMAEAPAKKANEMSETEIKDLQDKANQGVQAMAEVKKMKLTEKVNELIYNETNKDKGRLPATLKEKVVAFAASLSEDQEAKFFEIVDGLPTAKLFGELGSSNAGDNNATAPTGVDQSSFELDKKAKELQASNKELTYEKALEMAEKELAKK